MTGHVARQRRARRHLGQQRPDAVAGVAQRRQDRRRQAEPLGQVDRPTRRCATSYSPVVEALVRSAPDLAGEPVGEQVREQQQRLGRLERGRAARGDELVDRVERQLLQAGDGVQLARRRPRRAPASATPSVRRVAVAVRGCRAAAVAVEQPVVDRPGVDADAVAAARRAATSREPAEHLAVDAERRPSAATVATPHRPLGKRCTSSSSSAPADRPSPTITRPLVAPRSTAATRTVDGHRRKAAATPASTGTCRPVVWVMSGPHSAKTALATCSGSTSRLSRVRWA